MAQVTLPLHAALRSFGRAQIMDFRSSWLLILEHLGKQGPQTTEQLSAALADCFGNSDTQAYLLTIELWELMERKLIDAELRAGEHRAPEFGRIWITLAGHNWLAEGLRRPEIEELLRTNGSQPGRTRTSGLE